MTTVFDAEKTLAATTGSSFGTADADLVDAPPGPVGALGRQRRTGATTR